MKKIFKFIKRFLEKTNKRLASKPRGNFIKKQIKEKRTNKASSFFIGGWLGFLRIKIYWLAAVSGFIAGVAGLILIAILLNDISKKVDKNGKDVIKTEIMVQA